MAPKEQHARGVISALAIFWHGAWSKEHGVRSHAPGSKPHATFLTLSSNWPGHPTFYRITAGSNPARVAIL